MKDIILSFALVWIPVAMLFLIYLARLGLWLHQRRRLLLQGRSISWEIAIERTVSGDGFLVINCTSLPGALWWIPKIATDDFLSLFDETKESGFLVMSVPWRWKQVLKQPQFKNKFATLKTEPLP
jgi:hypothetical protein